VIEPGSRAEKVLRAIATKFMIMKLSGRPNELIFLTFKQMRKLLIDSGLQIQQSEVHILQNYGLLRSDYRTPHII
jgi:hypothetical protein